MRTANIHSVLWLRRVRTVYTVCSALELSLSRFESEAVHCVLCSRAEYTALAGFSCFENEEYLPCFAI